MMCALIVVHVLVFSPLLLTTALQTECANNTIRLVDGPSSNEGRVELCFNGTWGTVCDDRWDIRDAAVACTQLRIPFREAFVLRYPGGSGPIQLDNVRCSGRETKITDCFSAPIGTHDCTHSEDAGVVCIGPQARFNCTRNQIRLVGDMDTNKTQGRLEICNDELWGTVCSRRIDRTAAMVACRELGYNLNTTAVFVQHGFRGEGPIFLSSPYCEGGEERLLDCASGPYQELHECTHDQDITITCMTNAECNHSDIRLVDGINSNEGRVEICVDGLWGTVCGDGWDAMAALVACRQMGIPATSALVGKFGTGSSRSRPILLADVVCTGSESALLECSNGGINTHSCTRGNDASMICITPQTERECVESAFELRNDTTSSGYLRVCVNGVWSAICGGSFVWEVADATVACRQLGIIDEIISIPVRSNGPVSERAVVKYGGTCAGWEDELSECRNGELQSATCSNAETYIGAICQPGTMCTDNDIRLAGSDKPSVGRVEICAFGLWGTVCDDSWTDMNARVVCQQLGFKTEGARSLFEFAPLGQGPIFLDEVSCTGLESTILECSRNNLLDHDCNHSEDIGVQCQVEIETTDSTNSENTFKIVGYSLSGAVVVLVVSLTIVIVIICCRRRRRHMRVETRNESDYMCMQGRDVETSTRTIENDYRQQVQESGAQSHLQVQCEQLQRSSSLSWVRASFVRQLTEAFIIPLRNLRLAQQIGEGEFGIVYMGTLKSRNLGSTVEVSKRVAVKTLKGHFHQGEIDKIMEESLKMKHFNHQNILNLIGVCIEARPAPYVVMPYMPNGSLLEYLRKERARLVIKESDKLEEHIVTDVEKRLLAMCRQIAQGMEYLAHERFVHRDLAARNCMLDEKFVLKISDFGLSEDVYARNYYKQQHDAIVKLPVKWMAPESLQDGIFSEKSDVWAYGVTCWEVFNGGKNPYPGMSAYTVAEMIESGDRLQKPANIACSDEIYKLMMICWSEEPFKRPKFTDLVKMVDNRMGDIAGYLDVGYNPFISPTATYSRSNNHDTKEPLQVIATITASETVAKKPQVKPRTKKPMVHLKVEVTSSVNDGHYY